MRTISLITLLVLLLAACQDAPDQTSAAETAFNNGGLDSLPDQLKPKVAERLIQNYELKTIVDLNDDFFFRGAEIQSEKAVSFQLNNQQADDYFQRLFQLEAISTQTVQTRIFLALRRALDTPPNSDFVNPNLVPLMALMVDGEPVGNYYPLQPLAQNSQRIITDSLANKMIKNWEEVPVNQTAQQLNVYNWNGSPGSIPSVDYYTFLTKDTEAISSFRQDSIPAGDSCKLYLHFGQLLQDDSIALRTIIQLEPIPADKNLKAMAPDDNSAYFEFAKPCPPLCD